MAEPASLHQFAASLQLPIMPSGPSVLATVPRVANSFAYQWGYCLQAAPPPFIFQTPPPLPFPLLTLLLNSMYLYAAKKMLVSYFIRRFKHFWL